MASTEPQDTPHRLNIRLFGAFEVRLDGVLLPRLRTRKGQWLLALLVLRHGAEVERTWLAGTLWPDSSEPVALANLRNSLTDLRQALGGEANRLHAPTTRTLSFDLAGVDVDVVTFDAATASGDLPALEAAVAHYRGPLLEGATEAWIFEERAVREQVYLAALETLAAWALEQGKLSTAERNLRRVLVTDPLRESSHRALMEVLAASGSAAAALLSYRELRLRLHRELNAEPDPATRALFEQIRAEARDKAVRGRGGGAFPVVRRADLPTAHGAPGTEHGSEATLTFLFTDIEGSTRHWEEAPAGMEQALARHDTLIREVIVAHDGQIFKSWGDQFCATFTAAPEAAAALAIQRALGEGGSAVTARQQAGPDGAAHPATPSPLRIRIVLHTGTVAERDGDYFGPPLNRAARLLDAGHGGQTLLSLATAELVRDHLPEGTSLRDLGERRLRDLVRPERIFQLVAPDLPWEFPPLRSLEAYPHNLLVQLTSFIGRETEVTDLQRLLDQHRLVTLHGAGGCGKTRLALQVAGDRVGAFLHGVWLVELGSLTNPDLVAKVVASALGIDEQPDRPHLATLIGVLKEQEVLLLLDNCEHLVGACATLVESLLRACPGVRVLATSRETLGIGGEARYRVPSMAAPERSDSLSWEQLTQYAAVQLFIDRAVAVQPGFTVTNENAPSVALICHRLDGIPLAIELAAARAKVLTAEQIAARLDDRFRLLTGAYSRTALPRQQTLRALIDWSHDLLSEPERTLLRRLSVFSGGCTLEAAEAVCPGDPIEEWEVLDLLTSLTEKSLAGVDEPRAGARYRLLETIRQYAWERLLESGEGEAVQGRHQEYFLSLAMQEDPDHQTRIERLAREHDNFRAALERCKAQGESAETGLQLINELWWTWLECGHTREAYDNLKYFRVVAQ